MRAASIVDFEEQQRLADLLKYLRGRRSQREFGKSLGVSHPTISGWENCQWEPSDRYMEKIAELCGTTLSELKAYLQSNTAPETFVVPTTRPEGPLNLNLEGIYSVNQIAQILRVLADMLDPPNRPSN